MKDFNNRIIFLCLILFFATVRFSILHAQQLWGIGNSENHDSVYVYKLNMDGSEFSIVHRFNADLVPVGLVNGNDGNVYGMFQKGGEFNQGFIYRINALDTSFSVIKSLNRPFSEYRGNIVCIDNSLYYQNLNLENFKSEILSLNLSNFVEDTVYNDFSIMECSLSKGNSNNLLGGIDDGTLYEYLPETNDFRYVGSLPDMSGYSIGAPFQCSNGDIYTMCTYSGISEIGAIARYNAAAHQSGITYDFAQNREEHYPRHSFVETAEHEIMGLGANYNDSFLYTYGAIHGYRILQYFDDSEFGSRNLEGELLASNNGKIYGTSTGGGLYGKGCVFSVDKQTMEVAKVLDLNIVNGEFPRYVGLVAMFDTIYNHVTEIKPGIEIILFPNPATNQIKVLSKRDVYQVDRIEIYTINGKNIFITSDIDLGKTEIDVSSFYSGVYILKAYVNDEVIIRKFIKMK